MRVPFGGRGLLLAGALWVSVCSGVLRAQEGGELAGGEEAPEPEEIAKLRASFVAKLTPLVEPIRAKTLERLKGLESFFGREERFDEGLVVTRYRELVAARPIEELGTVDLPSKPVELNQELENHRRQCTRVAATWRRVFLQEAEKLQRKFADEGRLAEARYTKSERDRLERLWEPDSGREMKNVALASEGAKAVASMFPEQLNDGNSTKYDGDKGWAGCKIPGEIRLDLAKVHTISKIRFRLWDQEARRKYKYRLKVSKDGKEWDLLADMSDQFQRGWQTFEFSARPVRSIKIEGVESTAAWATLHVVELEAY